MIMALLCRHDLNVQLEALSLAGLPNEVKHLGQCSHAGSCRIPLGSGTAYPVLTVPLYSLSLADERSYELSTTHKDKSRACYRKRYKQSVKHASTIYRIDLFLQSLIL